MATTAGAPAAFDAAHRSPYESPGFSLDTIIKSDQDDTNHAFNLPAFPASGMEALPPTSLDTSTEQLVGQPQDMLDQSAITLDSASYPSFAEATDMSLDMPSGVQADLDSYAAEEAAPPDQPMQAYAKLQFEDGDFYVNTYAIELGRDINAMRHERRKKKVEQRRKEQDAQEQEKDVSGEINLSSISSHSKPKEQYAMSASNVSEGGGIIGANIYSDDEENEKQQRRRRMRHLATSNDSSHSQSIAPANLHNNDLSFTSHLFTDGAAPDGFGDLGVSQFNECQFVPIHPAVGGSMAGISRKHIRIEYNSDKSIWELNVLGRNGVYVDDDFVEQGNTVRLRHNSGIFLQGIQMVFKLPDNAREDEEGEYSRDSESPLSSTGSSPLQNAMEAGSAATSGDEEMVSPSKEPEKRVKLKLSLSKRTSQAQKGLPKDNSAKSGKHPAKSMKEPAKPSGETDVRPSIEQNETAGDGQLESSETPAVPAADLPAGSVLVGVAPEDIPQKRKGPGRPPKNGVMSKRDEAIIKRKKKELQKLGQEIPPLTELLALARAEAGSTVKKDKGEDGDDDVTQSVEPGVNGSGDNATAGANGDVKVEGNARRSQPSADGDAAKARRLAKSPSPQKPESEYTEEELKKPQKTYVVLIHDALSNCPTGIMDLQQIYDAIQKMYPYYKYRSQTQGWQSSIRHNLIGSEAFEEAGKIGKGRLWKINANYPIDKEKKRRAPTPPPERPNYSGTYYNGGQYPYNNQGYPQYRPSPYGTPYGPPTTMPNGARAPVAGQKPGTYYSPYATNTSAHTHPSPYGPPSRPPYAQPQAQNQVNGTQVGANAARPAGQPQVNAQGQGQASGNQAAGSQNVTPQPGQPPQQQSSLGNEETVEEIMTYHRTYVHKFHTTAEQDTARALFRKAVNRHIHPRENHGPFSNADEKELSDHIGEIIARSNQKARNNQLAAAQRAQGQAGQAPAQHASPYAPRPTAQPNQTAQTQAQRPPQGPSSGSGTPQAPQTNGQPVPHAHAPNPPAAARLTPPASAALQVQTQAPAPANAASPASNNVQAASATPQPMAAPSAQTQSVGPSAVPQTNGTPAQVTSAVPPPAPPNGERNTSNTGTPANSATAPAAPVPASATAVSVPTASTVTAPKPDITGSPAPAANPDDKVKAEKEGGQKRPIDIDDAEESAAKRVKES